MIALLISNLNDILQLNEFKIRIKESSQLTKVANFEKCRPIIGLVRYFDCVGLKAIFLEFTYVYLHVYNIF